MAIPIKGISIGLTKAAQLAKEAKEIAEKAAGFSKPRVLYNPENEVIKVPVKPIIAKLEEKNCVVQFQNLKKFLVKI